MGFVDLPWDGVPQGVVEDRHRDVVLGECSPIAYLPPWWTIGFAPVLTMSELSRQ